MRYQIFPIVIMAGILGACSGGGGSPAAPPVDPVDPPKLDLTAPTQREDGTPLSLSAIEGYRVYYGTTAGDYQIQVNIGPATIEEDIEALIGSLDSGTYYSVVTTVDTEGRESLYSDELEVRI